MPAVDVVITGMGLVSPIGIGKEAVREAFLAGRSGVGPIRRFDSSGLPVRIAGEVSDFDPKIHVKPRKNLKVMSRDAQLGVAASELACRDAGIAGLPSGGHADAALNGQVDPERFGVILGADLICGTLEDSEPPYRHCLVDHKFQYDRWGKEGMAATFPLSFLKMLPNMIASHISIAQDARGPNNTIHQADVSGLSAVIEAARVIQRGAADVMIAGGASSQVDPFDWVRHCLIGRLSPRRGDPAAVMRPFDADRDGQVRGEGAAAFIVESRHHAEARGATILARVLGWTSACQRHNGNPASGSSLRRAMAEALSTSGLKPSQLGHVNAHGVSTVDDDRIEARAIRDVVPDVPVTAPKSFFGNLGAAGGALEMAASVLSFGDGLVPATLNYQRPDPECPVCVIHGEPLATSVRTALVVNWTWIGQAAAVVLGEAD